MANTAYADIFKVFSDFKAPNVDFGNFFTIGKRNIDAIAAANQIIAEGAQAAARQQAELLRTGFEQGIKASRDVLSGNSPEQTAAKQTEYARDFFERSLASLRETVEMVTKSNFEAFDLLNKRAAESLEEVSDAASSTTTRTTRKGKK